MANAAAAAGSPRTQSIGLFFIASSALRRIPGRWPRICRLQCADPEGGSKAAGNTANSAWTSGMAPCRLRPGMIRKSGKPVCRQHQPSIERCPCGGTGRRAQLKIVFRKECGFDSLHGHQPSLAKREKAAAPKPGGGPGGCPPMKLSARISYIVPTCRLVASRMMRARRIQDRIRLFVAPHRAPAAQSIKFQSLRATICGACVGPILSIEQKESGFGQALR